MKLIVGLGNPGSKYKYTRHNVGFMAIDRLKTISDLSKNTILYTPSTFMNESGKDVNNTATYYKVSPENLLVIHDDVDLALGVVKIQKGRSSAGHKGVLSIINSLGTQDFFRIRVGIGRPESPLSVEDYVLQNFSDLEEPILDKALKESIELATNWAKK
ncbi:MAG: aminoacyl-tRNA hydrolase [Patescibacteria group bacterium]|nr:aminoacyl-tRNA hydrolase [Patescibacteria group bacterium]